MIDLCPWVKTVWTLPPFRRRIHRVTLTCARTGVHGDPAASPEIRL